MTLLVTSRQQGSVQTALSGCRAMTGKGIFRYWHCSGISENASSVPYSLITFGILESPSLRYTEWHCNARAMPQKAFSCPSEEPGQCRIVLFCTLKVCFQGQLHPYLHFTLLSCLTCLRLHMMLKQKLSSRFFIAFTDIPKGFCHSHALQRCIIFIGNEEKKNISAKICKPL